MEPNRIALQLYTVRALTAQDMPGTLRRLATIGYRAVELAGYGNATPTTIRAVLDEVGMEAMGAHVPLVDLLNAPERVFAEMHTLGCRYVVVPWSGEEYRASPQTVARLAGLLDGLGDQCRAAGLQFAYHNHAFEFAPVDGPSMWERLVTATDPARVGFELDVFWAYEAGADPPALIRRHGARLPLLHLKDRAATPAQGDAPLGAGTLTWAPILAAGAAAGTRWYIVEQDNPKDPLQDVEMSLRYLAG